MAGLGLVVAIAAMMIGQPLCQALGLPSWASIFFQIAMILIIPSAIGKLTEKKIVGSKAAPLVGLEYVQGEGERPKTGVVTIVEFWATWCPPCRDSIPHINELYERYKSQGLDIVGITNEAPSAVKAFIEKNGVEFKYPVACDIRSQNSSNYPVQGIPAAFLVGKDGTVVWQGHPRGGLDQALASALQSPS